MMPGSNTFCKECLRNIPQSKHCSTPIQSAAPRAVDSARGTECKSMRLHLAPSIDWKTGSAYKTVWKPGFLTKGLAMLHERSILRGPFRPFGDRGWSADAPFGGDDGTRAYRSSLCLFEDRVRSTIAHSPHWTIRKIGAGRYSHWKRKLFFSTSDGSDPNVNGRVYSFDFSLDQGTWHRERLARSARRWDWHPRKDYFRSRGGDLVPPPLSCNFALTNKCNLRCEICGSQRHLDQTGVRRRHMSLKTFEAVAETILPFICLVELNSQGDPLLHPNIDTVLTRIAEYGCDVKVQHNGTLLTGRIVDLLLQQHGTIMLSLDAVGAKFDELRRGGIWQEAEPGLIRLLSRRNPRRLSIGVYPTLTRRSIGEAVNVVEWSARHGADEVTFHRYAPVPGSFEEPPSDDEYNAVKDRLRRWSVRNNDCIRILFESECLNAYPPTLEQREPASLEKESFRADFHHWPFPQENKGPGADPFLSCTAPRDYIEIGLEGQIGACCRAQDVPLGYATSVESFADAWLGANYRKIRESLARGAGGPLPLPNCDSCMKFFAPKLAGRRQAVDYADARLSSQHGLVFGASREIRIEEIRKETGHCYIAIIPPGLDVAAFELWEDDRRLGPAGTLHDEIRQLGHGRYHVGGRSVYFSSSDESDAQRNHRIYALKPKPGPPPAALG